MFHHCTLAPGCRPSEARGIVAAEYQHRRLVKYYTYFGFKVVKRVGDGGLADLPDQVAWGGVGTRMDVQVEFMLQKWGSVVLKRVAALRGGGQGSAPAEGGAPAPTTPDCSADSLAP